MGVKKKRTSPWKVEKKMEPSKTRGVPIKPTAKKCAQGTQ